MNESLFDSWLNNSLFIPKSLSLSTPSPPPSVPPPAPLPPLHPQACQRALWMCLDDDRHHPSRPQGLPMVLLGPSFMCWPGGCATCSMRSHSSSSFGLGPEWPRPHLSLRRAGWAGVLCLSSRPPGSSPRHPKCILNCGQSYTVC